jgi:hypothetical protein
MMARYEARVNARACPRGVDWLLPVASAVPPRTATSPASTMSIGTGRWPLQARLIGQPASPVGEAAHQPPFLPPPIVVALVLLATRAQMRLFRYYRTTRWRKLPLPRHTLEGVPSGVAQRETTLSARLPNHGIQAEKGAPGSVKRV